VIDHDAPPRAGADEDEMSKKRQPTAPRTHQVRRDRGSRGTAIIEFALVLPLLLIIVMGTVDFGHLIQTRLIMTNLSREGASIASRQETLDPSLTNMLVASASPLDMAGVDGRIFMTRIKAGTDVDNPKPTIETQVNRGGLVTTSRISGTKANLGLTDKVYDHLVFNAVNGSADIPEVTVVEVVYKYRPITPLPAFMGGILKQDGGGMIIASKAVF
jgi:hypothetical protein